MGMEQELTFSMKTGIKYRTVLETDYIKVVDFFFDIFLKGMYPKVPKLNMSNFLVPLSFNLLPLVQPYESIFNLIKCKSGHFQK